jgi:hypothetical protein
MHQEAKSSEPATAGSSIGEQRGTSKEPSVQTGDLSSLLQRSIVTLKATSLPDRKNIWAWCLVASAIVILLDVIVPSPYRSASVLLAIVGSFWALAFYFHWRRANDARFVKELLTEFNDRYDKMGTELQFAISRRGDFEKETELRFVRYFNLCAEEWLFWKAGYIYDEVWRAWQNGMKQYGRDPRVMALWKREEASDSYYGFRFPTVETARS